MAEQLTHVPRVR